MVAAVIGYVVFMERAQRKILIQYPKRQVAVNMPAVAQTTHLPLKLNSAGVIPPIFASSLLLLPATITGFAGSTGSADSIMGKIGVIFSHGHPVYMICFASLINIPLFLFKKYSVLFKKSLHSLLMLFD